MIVTAVPTELVAHGWHEGGRFIEEAIRDTMPDERVTGFDVFQRCVNGEQTLWLVIDEEEDKPIAALVTGITKYPNRDALTMFWVGGEKGKLRRWYKKVLDVMEDVAIKSGCSHVEGYGRQEWEPLMVKREGWHVAYVSYEKEVGDHLK